MADGYHAPARYELAHQVVAAAPCPVLINGDVQTVSQGLEIIKSTGCWGVSVGRGAIRYPWIFRKANALKSLTGNGEKGGAVSSSLVKEATHAEAFEYLKWVVAGCRSIGPMKGYLNFLGLSVDPEGKFLKAMRQSRTGEELLRLGEEWLLKNGDRVFPEAPFPRLYARPSMERPRMPQGACGVEGSCQAPEG